MGFWRCFGGCAAAVSGGPAVDFRSPTAAEATTWLPEAQPDRRIRYAEGSPVQYGDLRLPAGGALAAGHPVAVVIHGGAWHADWTSDYTSRFAEALTGAGIATWNIEFRRIGNRGGADVLDLIGQGPAAAGARFAITSPRRLLPLGVPQVLMIGTRDETWRIEMTRRHATATAERHRGFEIVDGYPGTFTDVGLATDFLRSLAKTHPLDLSQVVVVGHSSGGHLALWIAGRRNLPEGSVLRGPDPFPSRVSYRLPAPRPRPGTRSSC